MSSLASGYDQPTSYHVPHHTGFNGPSSRNGSVIDGDSQSGHVLGRKAPMHTSGGSSQIPEAQTFLGQLKREKKRNGSRYRRSATLSPASSKHRRRGWLDGAAAMGADSSDSNGDDGVAYQFLSPAQLSAGSSWSSRRPSAIANSIRSVSPSQAGMNNAGNRISQRKPDLPRFARNSLLRKTCSEPTDLFMDECDRNKVEKIQDILKSLDFRKFHLINRKNSSRTALTMTNSASGMARPSAVVVNPLSPSTSQSSYASGRSSPLDAQSPDETWATPRGSFFVPCSDRPSPASLALTRIVLRNTDAAAAGGRGGQHRDDDSDVMSTDIEELKEAAQTIEALTRRNRRRPSELALLDVKENRLEEDQELATTPIGPQLPLAQSIMISNSSAISTQQKMENSRSTIDSMQSPATAECGRNGEKTASNSSLASTSTLRSGITTRLGGQPRGVMQFLPSVRSSEFLSKTAYESYLANKTRRAYQGQVASRTGPFSANESVDSADQPTAPGQLLRRKVSMPEQLYESGQDAYRKQYRAYYAYGQPHNSLNHQSELRIDPGSVLNDEFQSDRKMSAPPSTLTESTERSKSQEDPSSAIFQRDSNFGRVIRQYSQQDRQYSMSESSTTMVEAVSASSPPLEGSAFKGVDSVGSFSRFGRLLKSLRTSRQNSPDMEAVNAMSPASSDSPLSSPCPSDRSLSNVGQLPVYQRQHRHRPKDIQEFRPRSQAALGGAMAGGGAGGLMSQSWHGAVSKMGYDLNMVTSVGTGGGTTPMSDSDSSMLQADLLLWQRRSKGSLRRHQDTRTHIVKELYDTEASYVENLQLIVHKYLRPLKRPELCTLIDPTLVDEIFFQIPEVLGHHELFFAALKSRLDNWDNRQKIGDIILNNFTKQSVIDTYTAFINNWKNAKHAIRAACQAKPAFAKYLERCSREHKNKLTLDALLIMPVQRIPRYELLIKELLKHTSVEHPDHPLLMRAQKEIHELATKINHVEQEAGLAEQMQQRLREIEAIIDGLDDLVSADRVFYRYDLVSITSHAGKKERCLFLFSDQLLITNVKRKSTGALRKLPTVTPSSTPSCNFLESNKFKLLMKISLDDLEVTKNNTALLQKIQEEVGQLQEDLRVLGKVSELLLLLKMQHDDVEKEVEKVKDHIRKQLADKHQDMTTNPTLTSLDLLVTTESGVETLSVTFQSADKRVAWEKCFSDTKEALALSLSRRPPPVFLKSIAAQRTRSGLHYTCAAPTMGRNEHGYPNVWICNSDGYIGQVCVMALTPEADLQCCNGITNSRISCICAVPDAKHSNHRKSGKSSTAATSPASQGSSSAPNSGSNLELDSESSDNESTGDTGAKSQNNRSPPSSSAGPPSSSSSSGVSVDPPTASSSGLSSIGTDQAKKTPQPSGPSVEASAGEATSADLQGPTMWLGTEDGCIHIFNYNENVRTRKKVKLQHNASVAVIAHADDRVFVALGDGSLLYYERDPDGHWNLDNFRYIELEQLSRGPISAMLAVTNRLWMGVRNRVCVLNPRSVQLEHLFQVSSDVDSAIGCMTTSGLGVWLSIQGSPVIKLHHAHSFECLLEVNVSPTVTKTLAGCDDIIRQHKLSCLRVTALLCCKDYLWIGTSAGVLLNLGLPHITHNTTRLNNTPALSSVPLGHCGQCRFLTWAELNQGTSLSRSSSRASSTSTVNELSRRRMSLNVATLQQGKVYIISGGDGFEDFQDMSNDEGDDNAGRDDSTNHILIWQA